MIFAKGTPLFARGEQWLAAQRRYHPAHNIGHFGFYSSAAGSAQTTGRGGDVTTWNGIRFAFLPKLDDAADLDGRVGWSNRPGAAQQLDRGVVLVRCRTGMVDVRLSNVSSNTSRVFSWPAVALVLPLRVALAGGPRQAANRNERRRAEGTPARRRPNLFSTESAYGMVPRSESRALEQGGLARPGRSLATTRKYEAT